MCLEFLTYKNGPFERSVLGGYQHWLFSPHEQVRENHIEWFGSWDHGKSGVNGYFRYIKFEEMDHQMLA